MFPFFVCLAAYLFADAPAQPAAADPRAVLARSIDALGGEAALKRITSLQIEAVGHDYMIEQSERPEGPFIVRYLQMSEKRDVAGARSRIETQQRFNQAPDWVGAGSFVIVTGSAAAINRGERLGPASRSTFEDGQQRLELAPERVLFTALAAPDLASAPDAKVHGIVQRAVTFTWHGRKARLLIDAGDYVPTALDLQKRDPWGVWGWMPSTTYYSLWTLLPGGVRYPLQTDRVTNGVTEASTSIMKIAVNVPVDDKEFTIPAEAKAAFDAQPPVATRAQSLKFDRDKRVEVEPGKIVQFPGNWNIGVVQQPDGLVVIEAPIGSAYSAQLLDALAAAYPGVKVKAVVTTSDAWPHIGGIREYAARGIPIYALDLNQPILERLLKADHSDQPDALARTPKPGRFTWVSGRTVIGAGDTRIELYPIRGENGERMLMGYFPALKLLYSSDNIMPSQRGGFFAPETLVEMREAIKREGLDVTRIFGFHIGPTPWSEVAAAIAAASAPSGQPAR